MSERTQGADELRQRIDFTARREAIKIVADWKRDQGLGMLSPAACTVLADRIEQAIKEARGQ